MTNEAAEAHATHARLWDRVKRIDELELAAERAPANVEAQTAHREALRACVCDVLDVIIAPAASDAVRAELACFHALVAAMPAHATNDRLPEHLARLQLHDDRVHRAIARDTLDDTDAQRRVLDAVYANARAAAHVTHHHGAGGLCVLSRLDAADDAPPAWDAATLHHTSHARRAVRIDADIAWYERALASLDAEWHARVDAEWADLFGDACCMDEVSAAYDEASLVTRERMRVLAQLMRDDAETRAFRVYRAGGGTTATATPQPTSFPLGPKAVPIYTLARGFVDPGDALKVDDITRKGGNLGADAVAGALATVASAAVTVAESVQARVWPVLEWVGVGKRALKTSRTVINVAERFATGWRNLRDAADAYHPRHLDRRHAFAYGMTAAVAGAGVCAAAYGLDESSVAYTDTRALAWDTLLPTVHAIVTSEAVVRTLATGLLGATFVAEAASQWTRPDAAGPIGIRDQAHLARLFLRGTTAVVTTLAFDRASTSAAMMTANAFAYESVNVAFLTRIPVRVDESPAYAEQVVSAGVSSVMHAREFLYSAAAAEAMCVDDDAMHEAMARAGIVNLLYQASLAHVPHMSANDLWIMLVKAAADAGVANPAALPATELVKRLSAKQMHMYLEAVIGSARHLLHASCRMVRATYAEADADGAVDADRVTASMDAGLMRWATYEWSERLEEAQHPVSGSSSSSSSSSASSTTVSSKRAYRLLEPLVHNPGHRVNELHTALLADTNQTRATLSAACRGSSERALTKRALWHIARAAAGAGTGAGAPQPPVTTRAGGAGGCAPRLEVHHTNAVWMSAREAARLTDTVPSEHMDAFARNTRSMLNLASLGAVTHLASYVRAASNVGELFPVYVVRALATQWARADARVPREARAKLDALVRALDDDAQLVSSWKLRRVRTNTNLANAAGVWRTSETYTPGATDDVLSAFDTSFVLSDAGVARLVACVQLRRGDTAAAGGDLREPDTRMLREAVLDAVLHAYDEAHTHADLHVNYVNTRLALQQHALLHPGPTARANQSEASHAIRELIHVRTLPPESALDHMAPADTYSRADRHTAYTARQSAHRQTASVVDAAWAEEVVHTNGTKWTAYLDDAIERHAQTDIHRRTTNAYFAQATRAFATYARASLLYSIVGPLLDVLLLMLLRATPALWRHVVGGAPAVRIQAALHVRDSIPVTRATATSFVAAWALVNQYVQLYLGFTVLTRFGIGAAQMVRATYDPSETLTTSVAAALGGFAFAAGTLMLSGPRRTQLVAREDAALQSRLHVAALGERAARVKLGAEAGAAAAGVAYDADDDDYDVDVDAESDTYANRVRAWLRARDATLSASSDASTSPTPYYRITGDTHAANLQTQCVLRHVHVALQQLVYTVATTSDTRAFQNEAAGDRAAAAQGASWMNAAIASILSTEVGNGKRVVRAQRVDLLLSGGTADLLFSCLYENATTAYQLCTYASALRGAVREALVAPLRTSAEWHTVYAADYDTCRHWPQWDAFVGAATSVRAQERVCNLLVQLRRVWCAMSVAKRHTTTHVTCAIVREAVRDLRASDELRADKCPFVGDTRALDSFVAYAMELDFAADVWARAGNTLFASIVPLVCGVMDVRGWARSPKYITLMAAALQYESVRALEIVAQTANVASRALTFYAFGATPNMWQQALRTLIDARFGTALNPLTALSTIAQRSLLPMLMDWFLLAQDYCDRVVRFRALVFNPSIEPQRLAHSVPPSEHGIERELRVPVHMGTGDAPLKELAVRQPRRRAPREETPHAPHAEQQQQPQPQLRRSARAHK